MKEKTTDTDILEEKEKRAIEELKKVRWNSLAVVVKNEDGNMDISYFTEKHKKTILNLIETLIAENKELKEKSKELEESLKFQKKLTKIAQIITDESLKEALEEIEKDYISKSKVKEELKKAINNEIDTSKAMFEGDFTNGYIFALQSLLGKK